MTDKYDKCDRCAKPNYQCECPCYGEWISVKDKLPELLAEQDYSDNVLATDGKQLYVMSFFHDSDGWAWGNCYGNINGDAHMDDDYSDITHWMPLPNPPEEEV